MQTFTACKDCKKILMVTYLGQETHPGCKPTKEETKTRKFVDAVQAGRVAEADQLEKLIDLAPLPSLAKSALWYAQQGWAVFPLLPNSKEPHVRRGFHDATTDQDRIKKWWDAHPDSNIGLPTGILFDVWDFDGPDGMKSLAEQTLPDVHGRVGTPNGLHFYIEPSGEGCTADLLPGVDFRGIGGYVVAPPSQRDLKKYRWLVAPSPKILGRSQ